jgi:hypothetical protein
MIQYGDGNFSEIGELSDVMKRFMECLDHSVPVRAFHVGNVSELRAVKEEKSVKDQLETLRARVKALEPVATKRVILPTKQDILDFGKSI